MKLSPSEDYFILLVNSKNFYSLPYRYDLTPEGDKDVRYKAFVEFNK